MAALQEAGLWRYAATLTAHTLKGDERAAALERWAAHVHQVRFAHTHSTALQHAHLCAESCCWLEILAAQEASCSVMTAMGRLHDTTLLYQYFHARIDETILLAMGVQHHGKAWRAMGASTAESRPRDTAVLSLPKIMWAHERSGAAACLQYEGNVWRALGIMAAAGGLRNAALLLRELRMPDAAAAFCAACKEAGFHSAYVPADAGQAAQSWRHYCGISFVECLQARRACQRIHSIRPTHCAVLCHFAARYCGGRCSLSGMVESVPGMLVTMSAGEGLVWWHRWLGESAASHGQYAARAQQLRPGRCAGPSPEQHC